jgi:hypothetical protein
MSVPAAVSCEFRTADAVRSATENKRKSFFAFAFASSESFHAESPRICFNRLLVL